MRKLGLLLLSLSVLVPSMAFSHDDPDASDAAEKARQAHELAASDVIYEQQDMKALYYQNVQIVQLLKEIRDSLDALKAEKSSKNS